MSGHPSFGGARRNDEIAPNAAMTHSRTGGLWRWLNPAGSHFRPSNHPVMKAVGRYPLVFMKDARRIVSIFEGEPSMIKGR
jgi:hypothetical protein